MQSVSAYAVRSGIMGAIWNATNGSIAELHGDGVVELQLGHAPENRLSKEFLRDFSLDIKEMSGDVDVRSILLTSPFKDFSTGIAPDVSEVAADLNSAFLALYACPKPVVIASAGLCSGAGDVLCPGQ